MQSTVACCFVCNLSLMVNHMSISMLSTSLFSKCFVLDFLPVVRGTGLTEKLKNYHPHLC